ncbi:cell division protein FtsY [Pseudoxanthomonas suwonensis]|uniref:Signal recognition particle receptor FtsY n=1 Tax=Pseudoxanthomonas suwonensis TaxID=314722 RepID=A0A0E3Z3R4_9GAMM|nr:cell division protein FtsY [Pseudoxanthomonas suwonensis]
MVSFFRRKKPQDSPASPAGSRYSAEELAAAFPQAPSAATAEDVDAAAGAALVEPVVVEQTPVEETSEAVIGADPGIVADAGEVVQPAAAAGKSGWRERLRNSTFARSVGSLFSRNPKLDDDLLDEIETALLSADVGVAATTALIEDLRKRMKAREFADTSALLAALRGELVALLRPVAQPLAIDRGARPFVLLTVGVNGVGKTTTIGKLARRFKDEGRGLMLAAGDTFRAAAVAQLQAWGERNGVTVIAQGQNADAASVAFDALQAAKARGTEVLIADTAGRLHTQVGLMNELGKIKRVLQKLDPAAPHEVLMVIDGTTGQNALSQLRQFHAAVGVTGLVVTKLDGTAKGGVVFALAREFGIPIRFAGIGERPEDLRVFDAEAFVDALLPEALGGS